MHFLPDWVEFIGVGPAYAADHLTMCLAVKANSATLDYFEEAKINVYDVLGTQVWQASHTVCTNHSWRAITAYSSNV